MPVSVENSRVVYDSLKSVNVRLMSALPETWLVHLIRMAEDDPDMTLVRLAKEEEGVGISTGAHLAGVNGIVSCAQLYKIPLLMVISHRGDLGELDPWQTQGGMATLPVLRALNIPTFPPSDPVTVARIIRQAQALAESALTPVALLLTRHLMWEEAS